MSRGQYEPLPDATIKAVPVLALPSIPLPGSPSPLLGSMQSQVNFSSQPASVVCIHCRRPVISRVEYGASSFIHLTDQLLRLIESSCVLHLLMLLEAGPATWSLCCGLLVTVICWYAARVVLDPVTPSIFLFFSCFSVAVGFRFVSTAARMQSIIVLLVDFCWGLMKSSCAHDPQIES